MIGALLGGLAAAGSGILGSIMQKNATDRANAYSKKMDQLLMEREDNAVQRRLADVKAAGFSPLVAANLGGAGAGSYTPLQTDVGASQMASAGQSLQAAGQAIDSSRLASRQQKFEERKYDEAAENRQYQTQIDSANAAMKALDAQHYAEEKNLNLDSRRLANQQLTTAIADNHAESVLRQNGMSSDNMLKMDEINVKSETFRSRVNQILNAESAQNRQKELDELEKDIKTMNRDASKELDAYAHEAGYKNWQHMRAEIDDMKNPITAVTTIIRGLLGVMDNNPVGLVGNIAKKAKKTTAH